MMMKTGADLRELQAHADRYRAKAARAYDDVRQYTRLADRYERRARELAAELQLTIDDEASAAS